jgi:hypothetical protein
VIAVLVVYQPRFQKCAFGESYVSHKTNGEWLGNQISKSVGYATLLDMQFIGEVGAYSMARTVAS